MLTTLERILGTSVDAAFDDLKFLVRREDILPELAALKRKANESDITDYSLIREESSLQPHYSDVPVIDEIPFFSQDQLSKPSIAANEFGSTGPVSSQFKHRLSSTSNIAMAKRSAVEDTSSNNKQANHHDGFNGTTRTLSESSISNDGNKVVTPIFGKKQTPRATRSS
jgi:hypothetical protein